MEPALTETVLNVDTKRVESLFKELLDQPTWNNTELVLRSSGLLAKLCKMRFINETMVHHQKLIQRTIPHIATSATCSRTRLAAVLNHVDRNTSLERKLRNIFTQLNILNTAEPHYNIH